MAGEVTQASLPLHSFLVLNVISLVHVTIAKHQAVDNTRFTIQHLILYSTSLSLGVENT